MSAKTTVKTRIQSRYPHWCQVDRIIFLLMKVFLATASDGCFWFLHIRQKKINSIYINLLVTHFHVFCYSKKVSACVKLKGGKEKPSFSFHPGRLLRKRLSGVRAWTGSWTTAVSGLTVSEYSENPTYQTQPWPWPFSSTVASWALAAADGTPTMLVSTVFRHLCIVISKSSNPKTETKGPNV